MLHKQELKRNAYGFEIKKDFYNQAKEKMISEDILNGIMEDGQVTEKERAVIIRRAQAEGEDLDEVDIYIQSLLQKKEMGEL